MPRRSNDWNDPDYPSPDPARIHCAGEGCDQEIHPRTAHNKGWFVPKPHGKHSDQGPWCPKHLPGWVEDWREEQREKRRQKW